MNHWYKKLFRGTPFYQEDNMCKILNFAFKFAIINNSSIFFLCFISLRFLSYFSQLCPSKTNERMFMMVQSLLLPAPSEKGTQA